MRIRSSDMNCALGNLHFAALLAGLALVWGDFGSIQAETVPVPNGSFESPLVPPEVPYASTNMDYWQKSPQPFWYDPRQYQDAAWDSLMGQFFNVPFPDLFIDNCDGNQAAFLFAVPEVALFQDYSSTAAHNFDAKFNVGSSYDLAVAVIGGGGGMYAGATLRIGLYYREPSGNKVTLAHTTITNSIETFPTNTHFVDFEVHLPAVQQSDAWAGQHIGIEVLSTTGLELARGYWDLDNVRLTETPAPLLTLGNPTVLNNQIAFTVLSEPGLRFEVLATTNFPAAPAEWASAGTFTNVTGVSVFTDNTTDFNRRYYRIRRL